MTGNYPEQSPDLHHHSRMSSSRGSISSAASSQSAFQLQPRDAASTGVSNQPYLVPSFTSSAPTLANYIADDASPHGTGMEQEPTQLFACPYTKFDPQRYSASNLKEVNYRGCGSCYLTDISRLKQHLYRVHERPQHYCPMCYKQFKTQDPCEKHIAARSCTKQPCSFEEKMHTDQLNIIKKKNRGTDPLNCWYDIYQTLFPKATLPPSPYADFSNTASPAELDSFVQYLRKGAPRRLRQRLCDGMMFNEVQHGQILSSLENHLDLILSDLRREYDQWNTAERAPALSRAASAHCDEENQQLPRPSRKRKVDDSSLQVPATGFPFAVDNQSMGSYGDVSAPHSLLSTPPLHDDESELSNRRTRVSPAARFGGHTVSAEAMQESIYDPMMRSIANESPWQPSLAAAPESNSFFQTEQPQLSSPQPAILPEAVEWPTNMLTVANLTMGMGQPGYPANASSEWMGSGAHQSWQ